MAVHNSIMNGHQWFLAFLVIGHVSPEIHNATHVLKTSVYGSSFLKKYLWKNLMGGCFKIHGSAPCKTFESLRNLKWWYEQLFNWCGAVHQNWATSCRTCDIQGVTLRVSTRFNTHTLQALQRKQQLIANRSLRKLCLGSTCSFHDIISAKLCRLLNIKEQPCFFLPGVFNMFGYHY